MKDRYRQIQAILFALCILAASPIMAERYATKVLQEIGELLKTRQNTPLKAGIYMQAKSGLSFEVRTEGDTLVTHIGRRMVSSEIRRVSPSPIYDFIERYALWLQLLPREEAVQMMRDDKVKTDIRQLEKVDTTCSMSIENTPSKFHVKWENNGNPVAEILFPKNFELIMGMNKIESEQFFVSRLNSQLPEDSLRPQQPVIYDGEVSDTTILYTQNNGHYMISDMKQARYFIRTFDGTLLPINSARYPIETISNLFAQIISGRYTLHLVQKRYGNKQQEIDIEQMRFSAFQMEAGCTPYVGIEELNDSLVKACIIYVNELLCYNHLLYIDVPISTLKQKQGVITGTLYCYIPTHNLKALFWEDKKKHDNKQP